MTQLELGQRLRDEGIEQAERNSSGWVARARAEAVRLARVKGCVHIDDIRDWAELNGDRPASSRAWGAVFAGKGWRIIGMRASTHPGNHAHRSPVRTLEAP